MNETKIDMTTNQKSDYELTSNGSSISLSLNDSSSYDSDFVSGSSIRSSFGDCSFVETQYVKNTQPSTNIMSIIPSSATNEPVISLVNEAWEYRGEGGANLVISMTGQRKIIRFKKTKYMDKDHDGKIREIAHYANEVMRPALGCHFVRPVSIGLMLSEADTEHIRREAQKFRPPERCFKDIAGTSVILSSDCVFLTEEYSRNTTGDTFSVEIKPKQGWHSVENASCVEDLCHRCLKQYAKLYKGEIESISRYCPLDLFSGDEMRMKNAIFDLFERPHNRFKVFKNGRILYTESAGHPKHLQEELQRWLGPTNTTQSQVKDDGKNIHRLASLLCTSLLAPIENDNSNPKEFLAFTSTKESVFNNEDKKTTNIFVATQNFDGTSFRDRDVKSVNVSQKSEDSNISRINQDCKWRYQKPRPCNTNSQPLPKNCILQRLLTLQKHTDLSNQGAKLLCDRLLNNVDNLERLQELVLWHSIDCTAGTTVHGKDVINATELAKEDNIESVEDDKLNNEKSNKSVTELKSSLQERTCCRPFKDKEIHSSGTTQMRLSPTPFPILKRDLSLSDMDAVHQLQRFLLSVTAKDVSLLLTFRMMMPQNEMEKEDDELPIIEMEETGKRYRVMISVVDLDPKPVHRIRHWVKRKEEWLKIYYDSINCQQLSTSAQKDK